jgi:xanthine dehydrogenase YagR molybdenum-binding subunit
MAEAVGRPMDRIDGRAKITGAARYAVEHQPARLAHAALVMSTIARGRIVELDTREAERTAGVVAVLSHHNAARLPAARKMASNPATRELQLLQDDRVLYANQPIAVVVADTPEAADEGAQLVRAHYAVEPAEVSLERRREQAFTPQHAARPDQKPDSGHGNAEAGLQQAEVRIEQTYLTPAETHNPMEPHGTVAVWEGPERLTLYDATQGIFGDRERVAGLLGLRAENVRVISSYLGGGFGSKGPTWSHVVLAAMAARHVKRPVKLALARPQMFGPIGYRAPTRQTVALGARRDGTLTAVRHDTIAQTSSFDEFMEPCGMAARMLYACPNIATTHRLVRGDVGTPSYMRAPGWAPGTFALECAMDELAVALGMDPLQLRIKNHADSDPETGRPWSSKGLLECYRLGARRFGWSGRPSAPRSLHDGSTLIGWGLATSVYPAHRTASAARVRLQADGRVIVEAGTQDLGTGTYTVMTQIAADALGVPVSRVTMRLGDTQLPKTPVSGGSQTVASTGSAVHDAARSLREMLVGLALVDQRSPLCGAAPEAVVVEDGRMSLRDTPARGESFEALLARHGRQEVEANAEARPGPEHDQWAMYAFGAQFAEVRVDADLGTIRVSRMVGAFEAGRIVNAKTARSQLIGGMVWGIGLALHERTVMDERLGRPVNNNLAEYHVPVNADVPAIDIAWVDGNDPLVSAIGAKGIGEIGITGAGAAIANAVFHATGRRVRTLPITPDTLL